MKNNHIKDNEFLVFLNDNDILDDYIYNYDKSYIGLNYTLTEFLDNTDKKNYIKDAFDWEYSNYGNIEKWSVIHEKWLISIDINH